MAVPFTSASMSSAQLLGPVIAAGREGMEPDQSLVARIAGAVGLVDELSAPQLQEALTLALCGRHPQLAMQALRDTGLLARLLPELDATVDFSQEAGRRHKDVWEHTKTVVWQSVPSPAVRWAAVLHDIGKVPTRRFEPSGTVTFHGHAEVGERMFLRGPARRLAFAPELRERVAVLIRWHLRPGQYDGSWTDGAVRRFAREVGPALGDLLNLSRADITSRRPGRRKQCLRRISELGRRIRELEAEDRKPKPLPPGLGNSLMAALELPPGKHIGILRARLQQLFEAGELEGGREAEYYVEQVRARGLLMGVEIQDPRRRTGEAR